MKETTGIKSQDILILLKIALQGGLDWRMADLAIDLGLAPSQVSLGLKRAFKLKLIDEGKKKVRKASLLEFLRHGLKYVFPAELNGLCRGIPTAHSAPPLSKIIVSNEIYVWPYAEGPSRGQSLEPLHHCVPLACQKDPRLYETLALVDAIRVGRAREKDLASTELEKRL